MTEASREHGFDAVPSCWQDGLWFLDRLVPGSPAHNVCRAYLIDGELDVVALRAAWRAVVRRHEALRTTFDGAGGRPVPVIAADGDPASFTELGTARAEPLCLELAATPFDLARGPLARLTVARLGAASHCAASHCAALVLHRAVADESSVSILVDELSAYYAAFRATRSATASGAAGDGAAVRVALPALPARYSDYARWQREEFARSSPRHRRLVDWWTAALMPLPPELTLPVDRPRPVGPSWRGGAVPFEWGLGCSAPEVVLAAFCAVLARYTGEDRIAVGMPADVRPAAGYDRVVGSFTNLLVLPVDLGGRPTFRSLVERVTRVVSEARAHGSLPFHHVVRAVGADRDPRRIPLCDAVFVPPGAPESPLRLAGAQVRSLPVSSGAVDADLTLRLDRCPASVEGRLEYRAALFEPASARAMLAQLHTLLSASLATPDVPFDELPMDRGGVRASQDSSDEPWDAHVPVHELVRRRASQRPDDPAVRWDGGAVTYRELDEHAASIAAELRALGVAGRAVVVRMPPGPRQIAALLGVFAAGAHLVWFATGDAGERGRAILDDLRPACLLLDGEHTADPLAQWYAIELGGRVLELAAVPGGRVPDGAAVPGVWASRDADDERRDAHASKGGLSERAYVAYTSGSTGRPKGIAQTHGALAQFATWMAGEFGFGPGSRVAQWVAPEHDPALCEVAAALVAGAELCPVPERIRRNPERLVEWLAQERITVIQTVPSFARELLKAIVRRDAAARLTALERVLLMGEALPGDLVNGLRAALPGARLANLYGPTETIAATWYEITGEIAGNAPIGRPIPGREVLLVDEHDRPCPAGVTGEIVVRSPYVAPDLVSGEWCPDTDCHSRGAQRLYRTGDLGRWRWDGELEFRGRKDFQVKLLGNRLELTEIEAALAEHESVAECAVVAVADGDGLAARLVAYVVPQKPHESGDTGARNGRHTCTEPATQAHETGDTRGAADGWRAQLRRRFGRSMLPVLFSVLDGPLPRTAGGKVDRRRLPDPGLLLAQDAGPPRTPTELAMAAIWSQTLGAGRLTTEDTVFTAGGYSLLIPQLLERIRERFGVLVPLWEYFEHPTLAALSARVDIQATETMMG